MQIFFPLVSIITLVLPIGDSLTTGFPFYPGYRAFTTNIKYVGGEFDFTSHEGHGGWTTEELANSAHKWASENTYNAIFLMAGTNDILQGIEPKIEELIQNIYLANPEARIIIGIPPDLEGFDAEMNEYREKLRNLGLCTADMSKIPVKLRMPDGIHWSQEGYRMMGQIWQKALSNCP